MKKLFSVIVFGCFCLMLTSCAMNKMTTIRATGAKMKVPFLQNLVPIEGDDIEITIVRQVNYWFSKKKIPEFYTITIKQKGEGDTTNDEVIVEK